MKTNVTFTSLDAFDALDATDCERVLLAALKPGATYTDKQAARLCGQEAGWVSARRNALTAKGLIQMLADRVCCRVTGNQVQGWRVAAKQAELLNG
jgi:hypothetical protein